MPSAKHPANTGTDAARLVQPSLLEEIEKREPQKADVWYGHSILTSTLFPTIPPKPGTDYVSKSNGRVEYMLEAGVDPATRQRQFPSGKYPRLLMSWMAKQIRAAGKRKTDTVDPETRTITIPAITRLCEEMGLTAGGATIRKVQEQLRLLLACRISVHSTGGWMNATVRDTAYLPIVEAVRDVEDKRGAEFSGTAFILTPEVYKRLAGESAPYDVRAANYLLNGRSVLPYDVYVWLTGSMHGLSHPMAISWDWLFERFGDQIKSVAAFKPVFRKALKKVQDVYPWLNVEVPYRGDGIVLLPSRTAIPGRLSEPAI